MDRRMLAAIVILMVAVVPLVANVASTVSMVIPNVSISQAHNSLPNTSGVSPLGGGGDEWETPFDPA